MKKLLTVILIILTSCTMANAEDEIINFKTEKQIQQEGDKEKFKNFDLEKEIKLAQKGCYSSAQKVVDYYIYKKDIEKTFYWMNKFFKENYIITNGFGQEYEDFVYFNMKLIPSKNQKYSFNHNKITKYAVADLPPPPKVSKNYKLLRNLRKEMTFEEYDKAKKLTKKFLDIINNGVCHD